MHTFILQKLGAKCSYERVSVPPAQFMERAEELFSRFDAFNVTIPFKGEIIPFLKKTEGDARVFGAVNTVVSATRTGYNTDGEGFALMLRNAGVEVAGRTALVLGAGGAGRSVIKKLADAGVEEDIYPVSARKGTNLRKLEEGIAAMLPEGDALFSEDVVSDRSEKFMVAELMREKILLKYDQEIPHGVAVVVNTFERGENGTYEVNLDIVCEKPNHKAILIGKQGRALKEVASFARMDMEKFLGAKVFLTVYVKVREDWRDSTRFLKEFGYGEE